MIKMIIICMLLVASSTVNAETTNFDDATAIYEFRDGILGDGALLYRPEGKLGMYLIDLNGALVALIKHGGDRDCLELVIMTKDGNIFGGCKKTIDIKKFKKKLPVDE